MRDKYIELIINYIKEKPGYENALDDIKKEVLELGANEAEFDEAIKKITGTVSSNQIPKTENDFISLNTIQPDFTKTNKPKALRKILELALKAQKNNSKKKYVTVLAFMFILAIISFQLLKTNNKPQDLSIAKSDKQTETLPNKSIIPVVYANTLPVDADKVFSIKSPNDVTLTVTGRPKKEVLGFFPYWMMGKYNDINLNTLTMISLFGLDTDSKGNIITRATTDDNKGSGWDMWKNPELDKFLAKTKNYGLKVTLTIKSFNNSNTEELVASDTSQKNLIANISYLVNSKNLDGVNIDFEYVGTPTEATRDGFTRLITNLNAELKRQNPNATLMIDTYLVSGSDKGIFNIPVLSLNCDAFVIMGYDMHTPSGDAGPVAAMGGETNIVGYVQNYLEKVDPSKLILAVPYYGYDWPKVKESGSVKILPYAQIVEQSQNAQLIWDDVSQTPSFSYRDTTGTDRSVYFDSVRSLAIKYDFINQKNLKGVGLWALGYDGNNKDLEKLLIDKFINQ